MNKIMERKYFKLFFIFFVFTNMLSLGFFNITRNPLIYIVIGWSFCLLIYELLKGQLELRGNNLILLISYAGILLFATYTNSTYSNIDSYLMCILQLIIFLFIFGNKKNTTLDTVKNEIRSIIPFASILVFLSSFASLLMFFFNVSLTRNGSTLGLVGTRLFGVYFNCNPASVLACIMIVFSCIAIRNKYKFRLFYLVNIVVQGLYVILSGCRASIIIVAFLIFSVMYYKLFKDRTYTKIRQVILAIVTCILVLFGSTITQQVLLYIPKVQGLVVEKAERFHFEKIVEIASLIKEGKSTNIKKIVQLTDEVSSGRIELLGTSYKLWMQSPFVGIGANNFRRMGMVIDPGAHVVKQPQVVHAHNLYVEAMVVAGISGLFIMLVFSFKTFIMILGTLKKYVGNSSYFIILMMSLIVFSEFFGGMLDYGVFYVYSLSTTLAWAFLGYLYWFSNHQVTRLANSSSAYEFINYHLHKVDYQRDINQSIASIHMEEKARIANDDKFILRFSIQLIFTDDKEAEFTYDGMFKIYDTSILDVNEFETSAMIEELYEMVKPELSLLTNDIDNEISFDEIEIV